MATMRKMKGNKYLSRITWRDNGKKCEINIPLKTTSKTEARTRLKLVENQERDIIDEIIEKHQINSIFAWLNDEGTSKFKSLTLKDVIPEYIEYRKLSVREGTLERDYYSIKQLTNVVGENKAVHELNYKDIEQKFIPYYQNKGYENGGINLSLKTLRVLFNYLLREKLIEEKIVFKLLPLDDTPCYISRSEIESLYSVVDDRMRRWLYFYEMTGCRGSDPAKGHVDQNVWKISPQDAKTKHWHYYPLTDELKYIWEEIQELKQSYMDNGKTEKQAIKTFYQLMQKNMYRAIRELKLTGVVSRHKKLTLKSFRHTFGIINVVKTRDIWGTSKKMNHKEIGVTQEYLDIDHYIIEQDFPELKPYLGDNFHNFQSETTPQSTIGLSPLTPLSTKIGSGGTYLVEPRNKNEIGS